MTPRETMANFEAFVRLAAPPILRAEMLDLVKAFKQAMPELRDEPVLLDDIDVDDDVG